MFFREEVISTEHAHGVHQKVICRAVPGVLKFTDLIMENDQYRNDFTKFKLVLGYFRLKFFAEAINLNENFNNFRGSKYTMFISNSILNTAKNHYLLMLNYLNYTYTC